MDFLEKISTTGHGPDSKCPFCPQPKEEGFTSVLGKSALSTTLAKIMNEPDKLGISVESTVRPKNGKEHRQSKTESKKYPNPPYSHDKYGDYNYEAHHLIPGIQTYGPKGKKKSVLSGHAMEGWVKKGSLIKKDTGYSINNSNNGVWLPTQPVRCKKGAGCKPDLPWASKQKAKSTPNSLSEDEKYQITVTAMKAKLGQFHTGKHDVPDPDGVFKTYPEEVCILLTELHDHIDGWVQVCQFCGKDKPKKPPYKPNWKVHDMLDSLSGHIEEHLKKTPPKDWVYFISSFAMNYRKELNPVSKTEEL